MKVEPFLKPNDQMAELGSHSWNVARLFTLSKELKVMTIPLDHLNIYYKYESLTLRALVGHMKSVNSADLSYPIILDEDGEIMDGRHRVMKAILTGKKTIKAVRFNKNPSPCEVNKD